MASRQPRRSKLTSDWKFTMLPCLFELFGPLFVCLWENPKKRKVVDNSNTQYTLEDPNSPPISQSRSVRQIGGHVWPDRLFVEVLARSLVLTNKKQIRERGLYDWLRPYRNHEITNKRGRGLAASSHRIAVQSLSASCSRQEGRQIRRTRDLSLLPNM